MQVPPIRAVQSHPSFESKLFGHHLSHARKPNIINLDAHGVHNVEHRVQ